MLLYPAVVVIGKYEMEYNKQTFLTLLQALPVSMTSGINLIYLATLRIMPKIYESKQSQDIQEQDS